VVIMYTASSVMLPKDVFGSVIMAYYITGFPIDCVQAAATWLFLWLGAEPMLEKLDRIKVKYGLL
ncbi:MAG: ECF transporter S component, partial [Oscillospiraceae bacterium]|nr:ECF transporter S component [Oscillospiraceae bacterium]